MNNFGQNRAVFQGNDFAGNDVGRLGYINQEDCKKLCKQNEACKSVAFCSHDKVCVLKDKTLTGSEETTSSPQCTTYFKTCSE